MISSQIEPKKNSVVVVVDDVPVGIVDVVVVDDGGVLVDVLDVELIDVDVVDVDVDEVDEVDDGPVVEVDVEVDEVDEVELGWVVEVDVEVDDVEDVEVGLVVEVDDVEDVEVGLVVEVVDVEDVDVGRVVEVDEVEVDDVLLVEDPLVPHGGLSHPSVSVYVPVWVPGLSLTRMVCVPVVSSAQVIGPTAVALGHTMLPSGRKTAISPLSTPTVTSTVSSTTSPAAPVNR